MSHRFKSDYPVSVRFTHTYRRLYVCLKIFWGNFSFREYICSIDLKGMSLELSRSLSRQTYGYVYPMRTDGQLQREKRIILSLTSQPHILKGFKHRQIIHAKKAMPKSRRQKILNLTRRWIIPAWILTWKNFMTRLKGFQQPPIPLLLKFRGN